MFPRSVDGNSEPMHGCGSRVVKDLGNALGTEPMLRSFKRLPQICVLRKNRCVHEILGCPMADMIEKQGCNSCLGGEHRLTDVPFATVFDVKSGMCAVSQRCPVFTGPQTAFPSRILHVMGCRVTSRCTIERPPLSRSHFHMISGDAKH